MLKKIRRFFEKRFVRDGGDESFKRIDEKKCQVEGHLVDMEKRSHALVVLMEKLEEGREERDGRSRAR